MFLSSSSTAPLFLCLAATALLTTGCESAVPEAETDASSTSSGSSGSAAATTQPPATTATDSETATPPDPSTTTSPPDPSTTTTEGEDASSSSGSNFITKNDAGVGPTGICIGSSATGFLGTVHASGDEGVQTQCTTTPAGCGGDIAGLWTFEEHCGLEDFPNFFESQCPGSSMTYVGSDLSGSRMFTEDGTYEVDRTLILDLTAQLDTQDCFGVSCDAFGGLASDDTLEMSCVDAEAGGCDCTIQIAESVAFAGTYETSDDGLTLTVDGESSDLIPYCVSDGELQIWEETTSSTVYADTMCEVDEDCARQLGDLEDNWFCVNA